MNAESNQTRSNYTLYNVKQVQADGFSSTLAMERLRDDRTDEPPTALFPMTVFLVSTLIAILLMVRIWKSRGSLIEKLFWSGFLFIPVFGPLCFLVFYPGQSELEARRWAAMSSVNRFGGGGGMGL